MTPSTLIEHRPAVEAPHCPAGFTAGGVAAGLKPSGRPDLAVILAPNGAAGAAMLTTNLVRAAPLDVTARHLASAPGRVRALLINAGCANAATGADGLRRTERTVAALARSIGCDHDQVLVNSTGVIGVPLPDDRIVAALDELLAHATDSGLGDAAEAILTTDTRPKWAEAIGDGFRVAGIVKGAGMIHPDMAPSAPSGPPHATMIGALLTDAAVEPERLEALLADACERTFHRLSVDGDTSTNDAVFALASGEAGAVDESALAEAMTMVCRSLARQVARDGEGATRLLTVRVSGAATEPDARAVAETVGRSLLVRTAVAGGDPNWGRIIAAVGRAGVPLDLERLRLTADRVLLYADGGPVGPDASRLKGVFSGDEVTVDVDLGVGNGTDEFVTCDLTAEYVRINADYTT